MFASLTGSDLRYCSVAVDAGGGFHVLDGLKGGMVRSVLSGSSLK